MLNFYYQWGSQKRRVRIDPGEDLFGGNVAVRRRDGEYGFRPLAGYVSVRDLEGRSWRRVKIKADYLDCLPEYDFYPLKSGHVLGVIICDRVYVVLSIDEQLLIEV